jgi:hypothetical protein
MFPMLDIVVHERVFQKSGLHASIIERVRQKMLTHPSPTRPPNPSRKKWYEVVRLNGERFGVACRWQGDKILIRMISKLSRPKQKIPRKKN